MKDLYTFDLTAESALETYHQVRDAYARIFAELKLPVTVAQADSGTMGGNLSHEYHLHSLAGEDDLASCGSCDYVANAEVVESAHSVEETSEKPRQVSATVGVWRGITVDRNTLINVWYPTSTSDSTGELETFTHDDISKHAVKSLVPDLDSSIQDVDPLWEKVFNDQQDLAGQSHLGEKKHTKPQLLNLVDKRLPPTFLAEAQDSLLWPSREQQVAVAVQNIFRINTAWTNATGTALDFMRIKTGSPCPRCRSGTLTVQKAVELGHTFYLGTRYSAPLGLKLLVPRKDAVGGTDPATADEVPVQMGCYGIGISRILAAVADHLADDRGLNWPRAIAPFEVAVIPARDLEDAGVEVYDALTAPEQQSSPMEVILDDHLGRTLGWRLNDADLAGYPVVVVVGKAWRDGRRRCDVQCRRLGVKDDVGLEDLPAYVRRLLDQL